MGEGGAHQTPDEHDSGHGGGDDNADGEDDVGGEGHLDDVDREGHLLPDGFAGATLEEREETPLPGEIP